MAKDKDKNVSVEETEAQPREQGLQLPQADDKREIGSPRGSVAVYGPDPAETPDGPFARRQTSLPRKRNFFKGDFENEGLRRLAAISGRSIDGMAPLHEGDEVLGFMKLINVDNLDQVEMLPGSRVPEGTFVSVRVLPEEFLASLGEE